MAKKVFIVISKNLTMFKDQCHRRKNPFPVQKAVVNKKYGFNKKVFFATLRYNIEHLSKKFWRLGSSSIGANLQKYERLCFGIKNKFECFYISIEEFFLLKNTFNLFKIL